MKKLLGILLAGLILVSCDVEPGHSFSGAGSITGWKKGVFLPKMFNGDSTGFGEARDYCIAAGGGVITLGPGCESIVTTYPLNANLVVLKTFITGQVVDPLKSSNAVISRLGPASSAGSGGAIRIVDGVTFTLTRVGFQKAINEVYDAGGGTVLLPQARIAISDTAVLWREGVTIHGSGADWRASGTAGTTFLGAPGVDVFTFPTGGTKYGFVMDGVSISGGRNGIASYDWTVGIHLADCYITGQDSSNVYVEGSAEEWRFDRIKFTGGKYGFRKKNIVSASSGNSYLDKTSFNDCIWGGGTTQLNNVRLESALMNSITFSNPIFNSSLQHGFYCDGGLRALTFINPNTEQGGQSGKNQRTSGSITTGTPTLTVASATGFAINDPITVAGAGSNGTDLTTTISSIVGTTFTLVSNASTTVTSAKVTNASWDEFYFGNSIASPGDVTFIGGLIGASNGGIRYSVNLGTFGTSCAFIGTVASNDFPIYDPFGLATVLGGSTSLREPQTMNNKQMRNTSFASWNGTSEGYATSIPSPAGKDINLILRDSNDNGTGTYGQLGIRKKDSNKSLMMSLIPDAGAGHTGATTLWGSLTVGDPVSGGGHIAGKLVLADSARVQGGLYVGGQFVNKIDGNSASLNFGVPGAVPGSVDLTITVNGAALGNQVIIGSPITIGINYLLTGFVSAANTVTIRWTQIAGAAADPDGAGGTYTARIVQ